ncbi:MAG: hypothetical protein Q4D68_04970 [Moraxella equi]|nr:hypothetical protein [Moraxella equi]
MFSLIMARILWLSMVSPFLSVKFLAEMSVNLLINAVFGSWELSKIQVSWQLLIKASKAIWEPLY